MFFLSDLSPRVETSVISAVVMNSGVRATAAPGGRLAGNGSCHPDRQKSTDEDH